MIKNKIEILSGEEDFYDLLMLKSLNPFNNDIINLLSAMADILLHDKALKSYPDIATFAFFCRKNHLLSLKNKYRELINARLGKGLVFHIAPSNVPINFAYSLISALLAGNASVVKVSSKDFTQTEIIINALNSALEKTKSHYLSHYLSIVKYDRENIEITKKLSKLCDVRMIWGGDSTIDEIRKCPLKARGIDITFSDRYSFAIFSAQAILENKDMNKLCENFYNDTYLYDQNACTSPHLICFMGDDCRGLEQINSFIL